MTATSDPVAEAATESGEVRAGFLDWVTRLVHTDRARLYRLARREGLREADSFDCVQDAFQTFLLLPQARQLAESAEDSLKLLSVLVRNHARNKRRKHALARPHDSGAETLALLIAEEPPVDELVAQAEDFALMVGCLDHLGKLQRAVVSLRMLDGVAGEDVATMLGLPASHVGVLLHRAKQNLKTCMISAGYRPEGRAAVMSRPLATYSGVRHINSRPRRNEP